jgi:hypothetical protein
MASSNAAVPARENVPPFFPGLHAGAGASRLARSMAVSPLTTLLLAQAAVFAAAVASGKIPAAVLTLFRALLTL